LDRTFARKGDPTAKPEAESDSDDAPAVKPADAEEDVRLAEGSTAASKAAADSDSKAVVQEKMRAIEDSRREARAAEAAEGASQSAEVSTAGVLRYVPKTWDARDWTAMQIAVVVGGVGALCLAAAVSWYYCARKQSSSQSLADLESDEADLERRLAALRAEKEAREEEEYFKEHPDEKEIAGLNSAIDRFVTERTGEHLSKVRKALQKKERLQNVLQDRYEAETKRTLDSLFTSATAFMSDAKTLIEFEATEEEELAPLALLLAGVFAPTQLFILQVVCIFFLVYHGVIATFDIVVVTYDWGDMSCRGPHGQVALFREWLWIVVHCSVHLTAFALRGYIAYTLNAVFSRIANRKNKKPAGRSVANLWGWAFLFETNLDNARAQYLYDSTVNSWKLKAASSLLILDFFVCVVGAMAFFVPKARCVRMDMIDVAMKFYGTVFLVCFLINLSFVVLWLANRFLLNDAQAASLMRKARSFDAVWSPPGVPVMTLFLRTFVFRNVSDVRYAHHQCIVEETRAVNAEREALASQLRKLDEEKKALEKEDAEIAKKTKTEAETEEEFTKRWLEGLNKSLGEPGPESQNLSAMWAQAQQAVSQTLNSEELKQAQERLQETARRGLSQAEQGLEQLKEGELGKEYVERAKAAAAAALESETAKRLKEGVSLDSARAAAKQALESEAVQQLAQQAREGAERATTLTREVSQQVAGQAAEAAQQAQEAVAGLTPRDDPEAPPGPSSGPKKKKPPR
jgi:hypothetical protein